MKREELIALGLADDVMDKVMALNGADIEKNKATITALATDRDNLKTQLTAANEQIEQFKGMDIDGIKQAAEDWKNKYETDKSNWEKQLAERDYDTAAQQSVSTLKFTSESAKRAFLADLKAKGLPLQDGKMLGFEDFREQYAKSDPYAFAGDKPLPQFTAPGGTPSPEITKELFEKMTYAEKIKLKQEQPDIFRGLFQK